MDILDRLLDHDQWATEALLGASITLTGEQLDREFDIGHRTLRATFEHMIMNVEGWADAFTETAPISNYQTVVALSGRHTRAFAAFAGAARALVSSGRLDETFTDSFGQPMTFGGAIPMVILHNEGHRTGAIHILSRLDGVEAPEVDHGLWDFVRRGLAE